MDGEVWRAGEIGGEGKKRYKEEMKGGWRGCRSGEPPVLYY